MPALGPSTIQFVQNAGLRGVAFEAGNTILADRMLMIDLADAAGIFLLGVQT
jgi:hypothetical protein